MGHAMAMTGFRRFIVHVRRMRKNLPRVLLLAASAWFIYRIWSEPTGDSRAEKLIISQMVIIVNIMFSLHRTASV